MKNAIHWAPRVLTIISILFVSMFAFDSFSPELPFNEQVIAFLIHLIPSFILLAFLLIAWKYKFAGGVIFIAVGISASMFLFIMHTSRNHDIWMTLSTIGLIAVPFIISGILFVIDHFYGNNKSAVNTQEAK